MAYDLDARFWTFFTDDAGDTVDMPHPEGCGCHACIEVNEELGSIAFAASGDLAPTIKLHPVLTTKATTDDEVAEDQISAGTNTTGTIALGSTITEELDVAGDRDWFAITLQDDQVYQFDMDGVTLNDPLLRLYDAGGNLVASNDDSGGSLDSSIVYTATADAVYYVAAGAYNDAGTGTYELSASTSEIEEALPVASVQGTRALLGQDRSAIQYFFSDSGVLSTYGAALAASNQAAWTGEEDWNTVEKAIVRQALDEIESVINVTFVETNVAGNSELDFLKNNDSSSLGTAGSITRSNGSYAEASVRMNHTISDRWGSGKDQGGRGYETLVHEIGHALGLGHTHDTGFGSGVLLGMTGQSAFSSGLVGFNDPINSIMAYRDGWAAEGTSALDHGNRGNFGAWDVQALINLYGAAPGTSGGNDSYVLPTVSTAGTFFETITDTGGTDTITAGPTSLDAVIDLRAATLDANAETSGGVVSHLKTSSGVIDGGFTIAAGTVIENATGGSGDDSITGNDAANVLSGLAGEDTLKGGGDNDILNGGAGADELDGEAGSDTVAYTTSGAAVTVNLQSGTGTGGDAQGDVLTSIENLLGSDFADDITGTTGANVLAGGEGNDTIDGGADADRIDGDAGADDITGGTGIDTVLAGTGDDTVSGGTGADVILGEEDEDLLQGDAGNDTLNGGDGDDELQGGADNDLLIGLGDDDLLNGGTGLDALAGGNGNDTLIGGADDDRLFGGNDNDLIQGDAGDDLTNGGNGDDTIFGGEDDDNVLVGGSGLDEINGGAGSDGINGSGDNDLLRGDAGADRIYGGSGNDTLEGGTEGDVLGGMSDNDLVSGGAGNDSMNGGGGDDTLNGDAGEDRIFGGTGADVLNGGADDDLLIGQSGLDTFVFDAGWGNDRISGYGLDITGQPLVDEVIDLSSLGISFADLTIEQAPVTTSTLIYVTADGATDNSIEVLFRSTGTITESDFFFG